MQKLGIICGGGSYPRLVAKACETRGIPYCLVILEPGVVSTTVPHITIKLGEVGKGLDFLKREGADAITLAGHVTRPDFSNLSLDQTGAKWLIKLGAAIFSGDDALLKRLSDLLAKEGFSIIAGTDLLGDIFLDEGVFTSRAPNSQDEIDIRRGIEVLRALGTCDVGQAIVVRNGIVLGIECAEGTDRLIERSYGLKKEIYDADDFSGVLVKLSKPLQMEKIDLPTIGLRTIENVHRAKLRGLAVEARRTIILEKDSVISKARELGLFLVGVA